ncbi:4417_t:CDS:10 [Acaulospora colombiana]|uniref:4417_t:CDS:1 n=1 Tax=Acaulospora colombiana TaxID=27376 RepID=A0ACA9K557_9GLOM|nr:4417_t:CDS:10 [Acaulospora colombiana]
MSRDIVDDTIHEKVFSYLSEYASKGPEMVEIFMSWNVLDNKKVVIEPVRRYWRTFSGFATHLDLSPVSWFVVQMSRVNATHLPRILWSVASLVALAYPFGYLVDRSRQSRSADSNDPIYETFGFIIYDVVTPLLNTDTNFEMVTVAVNVIESLILLVNRATDDDRETLASRLTEVLTFLLGFFKIQQSKESLINDGINPDIQLIISNGAHEKLRTLFSNIRRNVSGGKSLILSILHAISSLSKKHRSVMTVTSIDTILDVLFIPDYNSDQRILKAALEIISIVVPNKISGGQVADVNIVNKTLQTIRNLLIDSRIESHGVIMILETIQILLEKENTGRYILDCKYADNWAHAIMFKVSDPRWEVRDSVLEFIGRLFEMSNGQGPGVEFALKFSLPLMIISKTTDEVAYVRASCLKTIQAVMCCPDGWKYSVSQDLPMKIASKLPSIMKDTEAFVRRAVMELMIFLIAERECGVILLADYNKEILNSIAIEKIMDDPDFYVRIGGCKFLEAVWYYCEQHRGTPVEECSLLSDGASWFYSLGGDRLLVDAVDDSSRLVRGEIIRILKCLKSYFEQMIHNHEPIDVNKDGDKSPPSYDLLIQKHLEFYQQICLVDFSRLEATIDVEHLYKEALESVNPRMMTDTDVIGGCENNALDCYF